MSNYAPCVTPREVRDVVDAVDIVFGNDYVKRNPILLGACLAAIITTTRSANGTTAPVDQLQRDAREMIEAAQERK